ncbi:MAG: hypothetical protein KGN02_04225 [bacterium]|nr:hypothetical protein [bacterium]
MSLIVTMGVVAAARPSDSKDLPRHDLPRVVIHNNSDAWVWITTYDAGGIIKQVRFARCVGPNTEKAYMFDQPVTEVRAEVTHANCTHPVMLDRTLGWDGKAPYYVTGSNGKYAFRHTPK